MSRLSVCLLLAATACDGGRSSDWTRVTEPAPGGAEGRLPDLLSDAQLKTFLPERLGERLGAPPLGAMTRMGDRALNEARRDYAVPHAVGKASAPVELKIADALLEPHASESVRTLASGGAPDAESDRDSDAPTDSLPDDASAPSLSDPPEPLVLPGAIGYTRFDEGGHVAQAQVVIANRFIASATVAGATDAQDAARALRAVDTLALANLAQMAQ